MKFDWRFLGAVLATIIVVFGCLGVLVNTHPDIVLKLFNLDKERNFPTLFSAALLLGNAVFVGMLIRRRELSPLSWPLAILFGEMACDETLRLHENLEDLTGLDWQIVYLPLILMAGLAWLGFLRRFWNERPVRWLWPAGAAAWIVSQFSEAAAWGWWGLLPNQEAQGYVAYVVAEETLEMTGSALFLLALVCQLQRHQYSQEASDSPDKDADAEADFQEFAFTGPKREREPRPVL